LLDILNFAKEQGLGLRGLIKSPLLGPKGNAEFLVWLDLHAQDTLVEDLVNRIMPEDVE
jgi:23S rRNA (cytidine1920-2'-O)/16S rRNA (cytidine1409-2'-O)-methyltransferase